MKNFSMDPGKREFKIETNFLGQTQIVEVTTKMDGRVPDGLKKATDQPVSMVDVSSAVDSQMNAYKSNLDPK